MTLAGFTAVSVNDRWLPAFIDSTAGVIHKACICGIRTGIRWLIVLQLAKMESLAVYFDTDAKSLAGLTYQEFVEKFTELVSIHQA